MGTGKRKEFGKRLKRFLVFDFLVLVLSFVGTAQFANETYQLMSFAGVAAAIVWGFCLMYCACSVVIFALLGMALRRQSVILSAIVFGMQILIRLPSFSLYLWDGCFLRSWHDIVKMLQIAMGIVGLIGLAVRYAWTQSEAEQDTHP